MLQAIDDQSGRTIIPALLTSMERLKQKKSSFSCPGCNEPVILKSGRQVIPHFAHKPGSLCEKEEGGEGKYHEKGKLDLYQWLRNQNIDVELEEYLPEIQQRPDLLLTIRKKRIAIEYQCAAISPPLLLKRTKGYQKAGITPIWFLGGNRLKRAGADSLFLSENDKYFLHQYSSEFSPLLYYYCSSSRLFSFFEYLYDTGHRKTHGKLHFSRLMDTAFTSLFQWKQEQQARIYKDWTEEMKKIRVASPSPYNPNYQKWRNFLYGHRLYPGILPSIIGLPVPSQYKLQSAAEVWQSQLLLQLLHPLPTGKSLTLTQCRSCVSPFNLSADLFPLIQESSCPIEEYLDLLTHIGILKKKSWFVYEKVKEISFPVHIEKALQADRRLYSFLSE